MDCDIWWVYKGSGMDWKVLLLSMCDCLIHSLSILPQSSTADSSRDGRVANQEVLRYVECTHSKYNIQHKIKKIFVWKTKACNSFHGNDLPLIQKVTEVKCHQIWALAKDLLNLLWIWIQGRCALKFEKRLNTLANKAFMCQEQTFKERHCCPKDFAVHEASQPNQICSPVDFTKIWLRKCK